jgi:hypothetical protein
MLPLSLNCGIMQDSSLLSAAASKLPASSQTNENPTNAPFATNPPRQTGKHMSLVADEMHDE